MFDYLAWPALLQQAARSQDWAQLLSQSEQSLQLEYPFAAHAHFKLGKYKDAAKSIGDFEKSSSLNGEAILLKALIAEALNAINTAFSCYQQYLNKHPGNLVAQRAYAQLCLNSNELDLMLEAGDRAQNESKPDPKLAAALLFNRQYLDLTPEDEAKKINTFAQFLSDTQPLSPPPTLSSDGKIRIGYLSSDLRFHSTYYFIQGVLASHDREQFEIHCFYTHPRTDVKSRELMELSDQWHDISKLDDKAAAGCIRDNSIDVILDLTGHMNGSRSGIFGYQPAVYQGIWIGWLCAMGFPQCNFRISDHYADPNPAMDKLYAGDVLRLEHGIFTFRLPEGIGSTSELPAKEKGYITFGSFNNSFKQNDDVLRLWASILRNVPNSMLMLKHRNYANSRAREKTEAVFLDQGISLERILFVQGQANNSQHLETYHHVDICLDPFPYNGVTTTCEALVMGLPVICLQGRHHRSRIGSSLLNHLGRAEWLAKNDEHYVAIAKGLASNLTQLAEIRSQLRAEFLASPLGDPTYVTKSLEQQLSALIKPNQNIPTQPC